ncbi:glutathione S-transferase U9-like [Nicotiana tabacum]|uniref:Glutathione S-transferase U9-like n=1 Tax=Nicotiana tabacum TaxID=4097 RepID=A0AC58TP82_TOBAC
MQEANKLILLGNDSIPYSKRVELALKIKGVPFELEQQESIASPTQPSSQKSTRDSQPSRATLESLVIIEYIDQTWKQEPKFLTEDPNERARIFSCLTAYPRSWLPRRKRVRKISRAGRRNGNYLHEIHGEDRGVVGCNTICFAFKAQEKVLGLKILHQKRVPTHIYLGDKL